MTKRALTQIIALLVATVPAVAQRTEGCTVSAAPSRRVELPDGRIVSVDVQSLAKRGDSVMVVGRYVYVFAALSTPQSLPVMRDSIIGILMAPGGNTSLVPSPLGSSAVLFPKVVAGTDAFHAVFATSSDTTQPTLSQDRATIWYARFRDGAWSAPERVISVSRVKLHEEATSTLLDRNGVLNFAFTFADSVDDDVGGGGVVMLQRRNGTWTADTLRTPRKPQAVRLTFGTSDGSLSVLTVLHGPIDAPMQSHLQLATFAGNWRDARVIAESPHGVQMPSLAALGDGLVAAWTTWEPPSLESSTIEWVRIGRDRVVKGRAVSWGANTFPFEMFVVANAYPIWLFHGTPPGQSIAVASVADSLPITLGNVAAPFENYKVTSIPIDRTRVLAFTNKVGKSPDEPPGALYATVLEFRCPRSAQR